MRKLDHGPAAPKIARPSIHPNPSSRFRRTSIAPPTDDSQITQHRIPTLKSDRLLAERLVAVVPCAEMVRFGKNGTDATSAAVRLARAFTGRDRIAAMGYHGWQDWYIGATTRHKGVPSAVRDLTTMVPYDDLDAVRAYLGAHRGEVAALILEPMNRRSRRRASSPSSRTLCTPRARSSSSTRSSPASAMPSAARRNCSGWSPTWPPWARAWATACRSRRWSDAPTSCARWRRFSSPAPSAARHCHWPRPSPSSTRCATSR